MHAVCSLRFDTLRAGQNRDGWIGQRTRSMSVMLQINDAIAAPALIG